MTRCAALLLISSQYLRGVQAFAGRSRQRKKHPPTENKGFGSPVAKPTYFADESPSIQRLVDWLEAEECEGLGGTQIGYDISSKQRRGLFATDDFQPGDFLLGIPFPCSLTLARDDLMEGETSDAELGLRFWRQLQANAMPSYFESLPTRASNFDRTPDFWSISQIEQLEVPWLVSKILDRKASIEEVADLESVDLQDLQFATWLVKSRGLTLLKPILKQAAIKKEAEDNSLQLDDEEPETTLESKTVMMPYIDMINHACSNNAELQVLETHKEDESFYALQAVRPIRQGQEITIQYGTGQESLADIFANYGFLPEENNQSMDMDCHSWTSSLEEDEEQLKRLLQAANQQPESDAEILKKILEFRIYMKRFAKKKKESI